MKKNWNFLLEKVDRDKGENGEWGEDGSNGVAWGSALLVFALVVVKLDSVVSGFLESIDVFTGIGALSDN